MKVINNKIKDSLKGEVVAKLYYLLQIDGKDELIIKQVNLDNKVTQPHLTKLAKEALNSTFINNSDLLIRDLSQADDRKNILYKDDMDLVDNSLEFFNKIKKDITSEKSNMFDNYNIVKDSDKRIFGYVVAIGNSSQQLMYFTKHYAVSTFSTEQFILIPKFNIDRKEEELFTTVESDLVRISKKVDIIFIEDNAYVYNLEMLESFFKYTDFINNEATNAINTVKELDLLESLDKLENAKDLNSVARKLARASKNSQVLILLKENNIRKTDVLDFVKNNFKYFDIKVTEQKMIVDTQKDVKNFLKLLADPIVTSDLTNLTYESTNKDLII